MGLLFTNRTDTACGSLDKSSDNTEREPETLRIPYALDGRTYDAESMATLPVGRSDGARTDRRTVEL